MVAKIDRMTEKETEAVNGFILRVTLPLLIDAQPSPKILGTGTLFQAEGRAFLVTAAHILKTNPDDLESDDIEFTAIAIPSRPVNATLQTLGTFDVLRPKPPSKVDVAVLELKTSETIEMLRTGWGFLEFDRVGPASTSDRFILSGYLLEGARFDGINVGQAMLALRTDRLDYTPDVGDPDPTADQFYYLQSDGELIDGSKRTIPGLKGLSGASIWSYTDLRTSPLWEPSKALHVVAVQSTYKRGTWFRGVDWAAVKTILRRPEVGLRNPPS
jgi:hypothetical protein